MTEAQVLAALREFLAHPTTRPGRADLVEKIVRTTYDHVKFNEPEGEGLDGRDGPERMGLAAVLDAAIAHQDQMRATYGGAA